MQNNDQRPSVNNIILIFLLVLLLFLYAFTFLINERVVYYNCRDIDYLPDVPAAVVHECRDLLKQQYQKQKNQEHKKSLEV